MVRVREASPDDRRELIEMMAEFRVTLASFKGISRERDLASAGAELEVYEAKGFPIYIAEDDDGKLLGFVVCRVDDGVVWVEALYVRPAFRRQGVGSALYQRAEKLASELGADTLYNWVHPNNDEMIAFLRKRGYSVLNLIEIRKPWPGEALSAKVCVNDHEFDY